MLLIDYLKDVKKFDNCDWFWIVDNHSCIQFPNTEKQIEKAKNIFKRSSFVREYYNNDELYIDVTIIDDEYMEALEREKEAKNKFS